MTTSNQNSAASLKELNCFGYVQVRKGDMVKGCKFLNQNFNRKRKVVIFDHSIIADNGKEYFWFKTRTPGIWITKTEDMFYALELKDHA